MSKIKIYDRINRRPEFKGIAFFKKSQTIPGQATTPQQLMRWKASGEKAPDHVYMDYDVYEFNKLDKLEQIEYLRDLSETYRVNEQSARKKIDEIKADQLKQQEKEKEQKIREQVIKEQQEKKE